MLYGKSIYYFLKFQLFFAKKIEYFYITKKVCRILSFFQDKNAFGDRDTIL